MPWVGLIEKAIGTHLSDAVENSHVVIALNTLTDSAPDLQLKVFGEPLLQPIEVSAKAQRGDIVAVDDSGQASVWVKEAARGSDT